MTAPPGAGLRVPCGAVAAHLTRMSASSGDGDRPGVRCTETDCSPHLPEGNTMPRGNDDAMTLPLDGMPTPPAPEPTAGDLVRAWCAGFAETHDGAQPDPSVVRRVAGICRQVAKDRTDLDSWRCAWIACKAAGRRGMYDVVSQLAAPVQLQQSGRGNHFLSLVQGGGTAGPDHGVETVVLRGLQ